MSDLDLLKTIYKSLDKNLENLTTFANSAVSFLWVAAVLSQFDLNLTSIALLASKIFKISNFSRFDQFLNLQY